MFRFSFESAQAHPSFATKLPQIVFKPVEMVTNYTPSAGLPQIKPAQITLASEHFEANLNPQKLIRGETSTDSSKMQVCVN